METTTQTLVAIYKAHLSVFLVCYNLHENLLYRKDPSTNIQPDPLSNTTRAIKPDTRLTYGQNAFASDVRTNHSLQPVRNYRFLNTLRYEPESLRTESSSASVLNDIKAQISTNGDGWKMLIIEKVSFLFVD